MACDMIRKPKDQTHHGNLREALILAGMQLLEEGGSSALTLRKCAALAGVSHAAPAHHFEGLVGLKTAIATRGYALFEQMMKDGINAAGADPNAKALGMSRGYLRFAKDHPALFNLIFDNPDNFADHPEWREASQSARQVLIDCSAPFTHGPGGAAANEVALFALAHGYAKLIEIGRVVPGSGDARDVRFEDILCLLNLKVEPDGPTANGKR